MGTSFVTIDFMAVVIFRIDLNNFVMKLGDIAFLIVYGMTIERATP